MINGSNRAPRPAFLPSLGAYRLNVALGSTLYFCNLDPTLTHNYCRSIIILRSRIALVTLVTRYMMVGIQIAHKRRRCSRFLSVIYKDAGMELQRVHEQPTNEVLTEAQEVAIREYIERLDKMNICGRSKMILGAV